MAHTEGRYQQDLGFSDGRIFFGPGDLNVIVSGGTAPLTRNAAGDISYNLANSSTVVFLANVTQQILRRTGFSEDLQEQFGGTGIAGSAQPSPYRPDLIGAMNTGQQLQPRTAFKLKGFRLLSMDVIYSIAGAVATTNTIRVDQTLFVNNTANAITAVLANGANGLATATQANPYVTNVPLAAGQQIYRITADQQLWIELNVATGASGTYKLYGLDCLVEYNFN